VSISSLIPGLKGSGSRRAVDEVERLREDNIRLLDRQAAADDYFALLAQDRADVYAAWEFTEQARQDAEMVAACMQSECEGWKAEALALRARLAPFLAAEANSNRIDVPPMVRDTDDPADQATTPIDVRPLWVALGIGPTVAVTNPGHVPAVAAADEPEPARDDGDLPEDHPDYVPNPPYDLPEGDWR
jgi:hypothetical protein